MILYNKNVARSAQMFFMFMMFMWVSGVSDYTSFNIVRNPVLMPVFLVILLYYLIEYCRLSIKPLLVFVSVFVIWTILSYIKYLKYFEFYFPPLYSILIAFIAFNIYNKDDFLRSFESILVKLCALSLIVWLLANLFDSSFVNFMHSISVIKGQPPTETYSFIVGLGSQFEMGLRRNIGFTWEPGVFSCWVLLGIYLNMIMYNFKVFNIRRNPNLYILIATLLSTLSTTGYVAFAVIILFVLINKKSIITKTSIIVFFSLIIPSILGLSFMMDKIIMLMDVDSGFSAIKYNYSVNNMDVVAPQRFTGLYCSFQNFIHDPLLGYNQDSVSWISKTLFGGAVIVTPSEGIIAPFARYGAFVGIFLYYWLIRSSYYMSRVYNYKGRWMFVMFFMAISFSYDFWENCIFMYFYLCALFCKYDKRYFDGIKSNF